MVKILVIQEAASKTENIVVSLENNGFSVEAISGNGVTKEQLRCKACAMIICEEHDGSNQKEIARACFLEAGSLTTILNKMEEKGLIERRMLNGNRRSFHIFMTEEGKRKQQMVDKAFKEIEQKALSGILEEEYERFLNIYKRIYSNLQEKSDR